MEVDHTRQVLLYVHNNNAKAVLQFNFHCIPSIITPRWPYDERSTASLAISDQGSDSPGTWAGPEDHEPDSPL